jgi:hypothetical protein
MVDKISFLAKEKEKILQWFLTGMNFYHYFYFDIQLKGTFYG